MNKVLITGGCSFSDSAFDPKKPNRKSWVYYLVDKYNFIKGYHTAVGASGNELITQRVISQINHLIKSGYDTKNIHLAIMWSGIERTDLFISDEIDDFSKIEMNGDNGQTVCFEQWNQRHDVSKGFIRSGGEAIDDKDWRSKSQRDYFLNYYENYFTQENSFLQTCKNILLIQNLCDKHNIKYCMFVYNNIFHWTKNDHTYRDFLTKTKGVEKMVDVFNTSRHIYNLIDFDKFIFYESDTTEMGGLAEFAHENDVEYWDDYDNDGDDFHVSYTGHQKFINHFENDIERLLKL